MLFDFSDDLQLSFFFPFEHASLRGHPVHGPLLYVNFYTNIYDAGDEYYCYYGNLHVEISAEIDY